MPKSDKMVFICGFIFTVALMAALSWMAIDAHEMRLLGYSALAGQAEVKAGLERIQAQNAVTAAIASQEAERAASHYRRVRELADTMQPNPFQRSK